MENTKKCPYSGETILATAKKCNYCGEELPVEKEETTQKKMTTCPACGEEIEENIKECPYCHESVIQNNSTKEVETPMESPQVTSPLTNESHDETNNINEQTPSFFEYYFVDVFFKHYADFDGKISRKQYWMGYLCYALLIIVLLCIDFLIGSPLIITLLASLALIVPGIAFTVRRLHDIGKNGWWILIYLVPLIGPIWWLILMCTKGETKTEVVQNKPNDQKIWLAIVILIGLAIGKFLTTNDSLETSETIILPAEVVKDANPFLFNESTSNEQTMPEMMESGSFHGYIDGKHECIFNLSASDVNENGIQEITGKYYYTKNGPENSIIIEGYYSLGEEELELTEYFEDGTPNCTISAVKVPQGFRGTFSTPDGKEMEFFMSMYSDVSQNLTKKTTEQK